MNEKRDLVESTSQYATDWRNVGRLARLARSRQRAQDQGRRTVRRPTGVLDLVTVGGETWARQKRPIRSYISHPRIYHNKARLETNRPSPRNFLRGGK